jgi:hypothetical protein
MAKKDDSVSLLLNLIKIAIIALIGFIIVKIILSFT